jgi:phenylacetate-CoA ligase
VNRYRIELTRPDRLDEMSLEVEARLDVSQEDFALESRVLAERIKQRVGVSVRTAVLNCGTLPRSTGKATRVVDRRARQ